MVNCLSTILIKVKMPQLPNRSSDERGMKMRKQIKGRGFWSWLAGNGWTGTGVGG